MEIKIGDKVKFLNDVGGGIVKKIIDKKTAAVLTGEGFEVPYLIKNLIIAEEDNFFKVERKPETKQVQQTIDEEDIEEESEDFYEDDFDEPYIKPTDDINIYFAFVPVDENDKTNSDLDVYIINDSNYYVSYNYLTKYQDKYASAPGKLEPNTKEELDTIKRKKINNLQSVVFQMIFWKKSVHDIKEPLNKSIKIQPTKFFQNKAYKNNDFFDEKAIVISVYEENIMAEAIKKLDSKTAKKIIQQKEIKSKSINQPKKFKKVKFENKEVDLHIHELIDDFKGLTAKEILDIQMDKFRNELNEAIKNPHIHKIIFIHGVGNGKLKTELRNELSRKYKKYQYQDASFKEYGYGATLVITK